MTLSTLPIFLPYAGRNLYGAYITPCTLNVATGILTLGTVSDLTVGKWVESIRINSSVKQEEISGANAIMESYTNIKDSFELSVNEIRHNTGQVKIYNPWVGFDYFVAKHVFSPDGGTTQFVISAVCIRASLEDEFGEGKSLATLTGKPCGLPIYYGVVTGDPYV